MDNLKFGVFLAEARKTKGLTQKELAAVLHVTDKAVSKWERGQGFPDISLLQPLAAALDVSVSELLQGEWADSPASPVDRSPQATTEMIDLATHWQKVERRNTAIAVIVTAALFCGVLLADQIEDFSLGSFLFLAAPLLCILLGVLLLVLSWRQFRRDRPCHRTLLWAFVLMGLPIAVLVCFLLLLLLELKLGAEVPWT